MKLYNQVRKYGARIAVGAASLVGTGFALAQETPGPSVFQQIFAAIGVEGVAAAVVTLMIAVIGIAMAFKGGDLGKRAVRKV
ncbi:hypothetical protein SAMN05216350_1217 [Polaromonas sp. YR568]|uniref:hypothetical protein n=1 Tax=Polaromonas sp. YR568 TaxID=1855301 RepID=UPI0008F450A3|nr:hypothetical protein [Polaromonas sp. YR568]SFV04516.1 hypothetical protein SAMN05216350_1217 [Polaromonas sp. YR568]